jgi:hypothetical protein
VYDVEVMPDRAGVQHFGFKLVEAVAKWLAHSALVLPFTVASNSSRLS